MKTSNVQPKNKISVAVVFYNPTRAELQQTKCNIEKLMTLTTYQFSFYLIDPKCQFKLEKG